MLPNFIRFEIKEGLMKKRDYCDRLFCLSYCNCEPFITVHLLFQDFQLFLKIMSYLLQNLIYTCCSAKDS